MRAGNTRRAKNDLNGEADRKDPASPFFIALICFFSVLSLSRAAAMISCITRIYSAIICVFVAFWEYYVAFFIVSVIFSTLSAVKLLRGM